MSQADQPAPARAVTIEVQGECFVLRGDRTVYWPASQWLIVSDLHLGKVQSLRRDGVALPDAVTDDDLHRLQHAVRETRAARVVVLGDLVHDAHGLTSSMVARVAQWRDALDAELALVPGNHDRRVKALPHEWRLIQMEPMIVERGIRLTHAPVDGVGFNWHGHIHPVRTLRGAADRVRLPCFVVGDAAGILPAFSALTGGDEQWRAAHGAGARTWVIADGVLVALPA